MHTTSSFAHTVLASSERKSFEETPKHAAFNYKRIRVKMRIKKGKKGKKYRKKQNHAHDSTKTTKIVNAQELYLQK